MRRNIFIIVLVMVFSLAGISSSAFALSSKINRDTLKGINGVYVIVEDLRPELKQAGLSESQIQTDVESRLRLAGIKVITEEESIIQKGKPFLYVKIDNTSKISSHSFCFFLSLEFVQNVFLERNSNIKIDAPTWSVGSIGTGDIKFLREGLKDGVDKFANDYLSVNPKK